MTLKSHALFPINAHAFFAGLLLSFGLLVWAGNAVSHSGYIGEFQRFHRRIGLESYFYPTSSLLQSLALADSRPDQTLVLIGGSSVFNGIFQPRDQLWTKALQKDLGPGYRVFNFAFRGSYPTDSAAVAAEILRKQGRKVIYVADLAPGLLGEPDGRDIYRYLFWDAHYKGLLGENPARDSYFKARNLPPADRQSFEEMKRAMRLNSFLYSVDFWNYVAYSYFSTIWSSSVTPFVKPRWLCRDSEKEPPSLEERYRNNFDEEMRIVRGVIGHPPGEGAENAWEVDPSTAKTFRAEAASAFKEEVRPSTILVSTGPSPYYKKHLSPIEQKRLREVYARQQEIQEQEGFPSINATEAFTEEDFGDRCHLSPSGGEKLALLVAQKIREIDPAPPPSFPKPALP